MATELYTAEEAVKMVKAAPTGTHFLLRIRNDAPIINEAKFFPSGLSSYVQVSRKVAIRLISQMLSNNLEIKGARMPIEIANDRFWFGA